MSTLTFFLHGTAQHEKGSQKTIISALSENCSSPAYVVNGPGGRSQEKGVHPFIPGTFRINPETGKRVPLRTHVPTSLSQLVGMATGWGVEHNLIEMLIQVERQNPPPDTINMIGFSRGADASLRFANVLYEFYPHIKVNIFAVDPVPGPGRQSAEQARRIPPNVAHYLSTLALNENRPPFNPQDYSLLKPSDFEATKVECLPFPGVHSVHSQISDDHPGTWAASEIIQDLAIDQLKEWGSSFRRDPGYPIIRDKKLSYEVRTNLSPEGTIFKYTSMMLGIQKYGKSSNVRSASKNKEDYSPILPHCFINQHHMKVFAKAFPVTYRYMLDPTETRKENSETELQNYPRVQEWLKKTFEANPDIKQKIYFNIRNDRLDGNYLRVTLAVHHFMRNPMISKKEKDMARKLVADCQNILKRPYTNKELEIQKKVDEFFSSNKDSRLTRLLQKQFMAKAPSVRERVLHDLKAAKNQSLFARAVEGLEKTLNKKKEKNYSARDQILSKSLDIITSNEKMEEHEITDVLRSAKREIEQYRKLQGIKKRSTTERHLDKLISRTESKIALEIKSTPIVFKKSK